MPKNSEGFLIGMCYVANNLQSSYSQSHPGATVTLNMSMMDPLTMKVCVLTFR